MVCCGAKVVLYNVELATKKGKCYCIIFSSDKSERDPGRGGVGAFSLVDTLKSSLSKSRC